MTGDLRSRADRESARDLVARLRAESAINRATVEVPTILLIRAGDRIEVLTDALRACLTVVTGENTNKKALIEALELGRSALSLEGSLMANLIEITQAEIAALISVSDRDNVLPIRFGGNRSYLDLDAATNKITDHLKKMRRAALDDKGTAA